MLVGEHPLASSSAPKTSTTVSGAGLQRCISCCSSFLPLSSLFAIAVFAVSEFFDLWVVDCKEHMLEEDDELANDVRSYYEWWLYIVGNLDVGIVGNLVICLICLLTLLNLLAEGVNLRPNSGFDRTFRITARELQGEFRGELRGELWGELAGDVEHFDHRDVPMSAKAAAEEALVASLKERDAKKAEAAIAEAKAAGGHESSRPPPPPPPPPRDASSEVLLAVASSEAPPPAANSLVDPAIMDLRFKVRETEEAVARTVVWEAEKNAASIKAKVDKVKAFGSKTEAVGMMAGSPIPNVVAVKARLQSLVGVQGAMAEDALVASLMAKAAAKKEAAAHAAAEKAEKAAAEKAAARAEPVDARALPSSSEFRPPPPPSSPPLPSTPLPSTPSSSVFRPPLPSAFGRERLGREILGRETCSSPSPEKAAAEKAAAGKAAADEAAAQAAAKASAERAERAAAERAAAEKVEAERVAGKTAEMEVAKVAEAKAAEAASLFIPTPPLNGHRYARRHTASDARMPNKAIEMPEKATGQPHSPHSPGVRRLKPLEEAVLYAAMEKAMAEEETSGSALGGPSGCSSAAASGDARPREASTQISPKTASRWYPAVAVAELDESTAVAEREPAEPLMQPSAAGREKPPRASAFRVHK